jgi:hypothetical protein
LWNTASSWQFVLSTMGVALLPIAMVQLVGWLWAWQWGVWFYLEDFLRGGFGEILESQDMELGVLAWYTVTASTFLADIDMMCESMRDAMRCHISEGKIAAWGSSWDDGYWSRVMAEEREADFLVAELGVEGYLGMISSEKSIHKYLDDILPTVKGCREAWSSY